MREQKLLIETSAVLPAIGFSNHAHNEHFKATIQDRELSNSVYVRMETLRKWICEAIEFAELAEQCSSVSDAMNFWSQKYGRKPKIALDLAAWLIKDKKLIDDTDTHQFAVEVAQKALDLILAFDLRLSSKANNTCHCQIGSVEIKCDRRRLLRDLSEFRKQFLTDIQDCRINEFLQLGNDRGKAAKLLSCAHVAADPKISDPLRKVFESGRVVCSSCRTVGDQVIALEHSSRMTLVHVDNSYDKLCSCTGRTHLKLRSAASFKPQSPPLQS